MGNPSWRCPIPSATTFPSQHALISALLTHHVVCNLSLKPLDTHAHTRLLCFRRGRTRALHCLCVKTADGRWNRIYQDPSTPLKITPFHTHSRSRNKQHSATLARLLPVRVGAGRRMGFLHASSAAWNIVIEGSRCSHRPLIGFFRLALPAGLRWPPPLSARGHWYGIKTR